MEEAAKAAEQQLKKAEVKVLRGMLAESRGKHDWTSILKECLKDEKKKLDLGEFLNYKLEIGISKTKGLGLVAKGGIIIGIVKKTRPIGQ